MNAPAQIESKPFVIDDKFASAPIDGLSPVQCEALVTLFFAGEMYRNRGNYCADNSPDIKGQTAQVLHRQGLIKLVCTSPKKNSKNIAYTTYRYTIQLTPHGLWFVNAIMRRSAYASSPALSPDNFEDATNVYADAEPVQS